MAGFASHLPQRVLFLFANRVNCENRQRQKTQAGDESSDDIGNVGIITIAIFQRLEVEKRVNHDHSHKSGRQIFPADSPVEIRVEAEHEFNVPTEAVDSIDVAKRVKLSDGKNESDEGCAVIVNELEN